MQFNAAPELKYLMALITALSLLWGFTLSWFYFQLEMHFDISMVGVWLGLLLLTLITTIFLAFSQADIRQKQIQQHKDLLGFILLSWTLIINAGLLYETGGTINPLIHFLLLPIALGMLILTTHWFLALAGIAGLLYTLLTHYYVPLLSLKVTSLQAFFAWYLQGSMLVFLGLVLLLAILIFPLKSRLEAQKSALNQQQQLALQNETLLSVGSLASASVHQLSTPLNTLFLLKDLLKNEVHSDVGKAQLKTLSEQIEVCIHVLQTLRERADQANHQTHLEFSATTLLTELKHEFALMHPKSQLMIRNTLTIDPKINIDTSFKIAIMNLLDNAARLSPNAVQISLEQIDSNLCFRILDEGGGLPETRLNTLGQQQLQQHYHGIGMGVFLSRMIIERFGGNLSFQNIHQNNKDGLMAMITLPISSTAGNPKDL